MIFFVAFHLLVLLPHILIRKMFPLTANELRYVSKRPLRWSYKRGQETTHIRLIS